ncbi:MAG TPA: thiamine pyrophosphate-dependent enzyme [Dehalococcoidales bacterium]|nr:thiamine pyrophosphate-dependent enzyme [Dehalococcoidales bacterium]
MVEGTKKRGKVFEYFSKEDQFSPGLAWCPGCTLEILARYAPKVLGKDMVVFGCPCCSAPILFGQNMGAWHKLASMGCLMTGVPSSATGVARYYRKIGKEATIVCWTGDGGAADVGFQPLSGAAERAENIIYICYDNEGYMNTGVQRSSGTPKGAATTTTPVGKKWLGKPTHSKYMPLVMLMHQPAYVATATVSHLDDLVRKLEKAKEKKNEGFVYLHVYAPCPVGSRMESDSVIQVCRTAVNTNYFPLWEAENGKLRMTHEVAKPKPVGELLKMAGKFSHMKEEAINDLQQVVNERYSLIKYLSEKDQVKSK